MVPDTDSDDGAEAEDDDGSRFGRWWQHFLDLFEFVLDLF